MTSQVKMDIGKMKKYLRKDGAKRYPTNRTNNFRDGEKRRKLINREKL